jgi:hypothetical protein
VADVEKAEGPSEAAGPAGAAIACHDPFGANALVVKPTQGTQEETGCGLLSRALQHLDISEPCRVINRDKDEVPARAAAATGRACFGGTVAGLVEPPERLDIEAGHDQGAGVRI